MDQGWVPPSQLNPPPRPPHQHVDKWSKPNVEEGNLGLQPPRNQKDRFGQSFMDYLLTIDHRTMEFEFEGCWIAKTELYSYFYKCQQSKCNCFFLTKIWFYFFHQNDFQITIFVVVGVVTWFWHIKERGRLLVTRTDASLVWALFTSLNEGMQYGARQV